MNKEKIKSFFQKVLFTVKKYWYLVAAAVVGVLMIFYMKKGPLESLYGSLMARYRQTLEDSRDDMQQISDIRTEEQVSEDKLNEEYENTLRVLQDKHNVEVEKLSDEQVTTIRQIMADTQGNPELMASKISESFGIPLTSRSAGDE